MVGDRSEEKKQMQIDIVGTPIEGKDYIIGSCKYRNEKIGMDEFDLLRITHQFSEKRIIITIISFQKEVLRLDFSGTGAR